MKPRLKVPVKRKNSTLLAPLSMSLYGFNYMAYECSQPAIVYRASTVTHYTLLNF